MFQRIRELHVWHALDRAKTQSSNPGLIDQMLHPATQQAEEAWAVFQIRFHHEVVLGTPEGRSLVAGASALALPAGWFANLLALIVKYLPQILAIIMSLFGGPTPVPVPVP